MDHERNETRVAVNLPDQAYEVRVARGLLPSIGRIVREFSPTAKKALVLTDANVAGVLLEPVTATLEAAGYQVTSCAIAGGETSKSLEGLAPAYDAFLSAGIDRRTPLIALGGGIIGDMGGFVAATLLRGVPLIQVPTTLLAMVDSSVGGKTGVNHRVGKNLVGAFYHPSVVVADVETLRTLPQRELRAGLAECIKHDIIRDADGFASLEESVADVLQLYLDRLVDLVAHNVAIKAKVVMADPFEHGERAHLNLGHTFGHAIETTTNYKYLHGEAVALGLVAAARLAQSLALIDAPTAGRIVRLVAAAGLPTHASDLDTDRIVASMAHDKKVRDGRLRFVLPNGLGSAVVRDDVPVELVRQAVQSLRG
ncbi:MAG TPA: 3-dehydroquinate synthase [Tepidisphaeraceae bacterium]|nr:3-dehydroquinate synthase [Tepidisphaeraceae bacterium]